MLLITELRVIAVILEHGMIVQVVLSNLLML